MRFRVWKKVDGMWIFHGEYKGAVKLAYAVYIIGRKKEIEDLAIEEVQQ